MITTYKTILSDKKQLLDNIFHFTFKLVEPTEINFLPGQYLILKVNTKPRLYSIFSSNKAKNQVDFIIEIIPGGLASTYFLGLKIGDQVEFQGPLGQFTLRENNKEKIFLTTGTGIAPVISILESYSLDVARFQLYWGLKTYKEVYLFEELKKFSPKICLSRESSLDLIPKELSEYFELGRIDSCFNNQFDDKTVEQLNSYDYYLCGRKDIIESLKVFLLAKNIHQENIYFEKF